MDWIALGSFVSGTLVGALGMAGIAWRRVTVERTRGDHHHATVERLVGGTVVPLRRAS